MGRISWLFAAVLFTLPAEAQVVQPEIHHVRWPAGEPVPQRVFQAVVFRQR